MAEERDPVEVEARSLGWVPKEEFKGAENRWVDAASFVERGHTVLPIVQENNKRLQETVGRVQNELAANTAALRAAQATIEALEASREEDVKEQVAAARVELKAQIKAARAAEDVDAELDAQEKLSKLNGVGKEARPAAKQVEGAPPIDPRFAAWVAKPENAWFGVDMRKTGLAEGIARDLRLKGEMSVGELFMEKVVAELETMLPRPSGDKVEGGGSRPSGGSTTHSYDNLPPEAKQACDSMSKKLVGANRAHKDINSWRKSYAAQYFKE